MKNVTAYWILPEPIAAEILSAKIAELATRFRAPVFVPHVTVFVAEHEHNSKEVVAQLNPIDLTLIVNGISYGEEFTKTLFFELAGSDALQQLSQRIRALTGANNSYDLNPHLSLLYADLPLQKKRALTNEIKTPWRETRFNRVWAMRCAQPTSTAEEVRAWRLLAQK